MKKELCAPHPELLFLLGLLFSLVGCSRFFGPISGRVLIQDAALESLANQPNAVCYLMLKDQGGVPVVIQRWLNPKFPRHFSLTRSDLLLPTRAWRGPFQVEAYLFLSTNPKRELPPPADAAFAHWPNPVFPGESSLELVLK